MKIQISLQSKQDVRLRNVWHSICDFFTHNLYFTLLHSDSPKLHVFFSLSECNRVKQPVSPLQYLVRNNNKLKQ